MAMILKNVAKHSWQLKRDSKGFHTIITKKSSTIFKTISIR